MCDPVSVMATVAVVSTVYSMQQQREQQKYQAGVDNYNARVAENDAQKVRSIGVEEENIKRQQTAQLMSKQQAQLGAANVDLSSGSALQLQQDTATLGEADALRIRSNFENKAQSLETQAALLKKDAPDDFLSKAGSFFKKTNVFTATSSHGVSDKWYSPNSAAYQSV